jgi:hypothetical protein
MIRTKSFAEDYKEGSDLKADCFLHRLILTSALMQELIISDWKLVPPSKPSCHRVQEGWVKKGLFLLLACLP